MFGMSRSPNSIRTLRWCPRNIQFQAYRIVAGELAGKATSGVSLLFFGAGRRQNRTPPLRRDREEARLGATPA